MTCGLTSFARLRANSISTNDFLHRSWSKRDGLPDNTIHNICQTRDGYLWLSTPAGLARFDGLAFTVFKHSNTPAMPDDYCAGLAADPNGTLWIASRGGLLGYRDGTILLYENGGLFLDSIAALVVSHDGSLWIGASGRLFNLREGRLTQFPDPEQTLRGQICSLYEDRAGLIWMGVGHGLYQLDPRRGTIQHRTGLPNGEVRALRQDESGTFWALAGLGLYRGGPDEWETVRPPRLDLIFYGAMIVPDQAGRLWVTSPDDGIECFTDGKLTHLAIPDTSPEDTVMCCYTDREGNLWLGMERSGLHQWRQRRVKVISTAQGLPHRQAWAVTQATDDRLWVATDDGVGIARQERVEAVRPDDGLSAPAVRALAEDDQGRMWIGTGAGLDVWVAGALQRHRFAGEYFNTKIRALWFEGPHQLWVGSLNGLHRLDLETDWARPSEASRASLTLELRPEMSLTVTNGLDPSDVRALFGDASGALWIGTYGGGLFRFRAGKLDQFTTRDGLPSDRVYAFHQSVRERPTLLQAVSPGDEATRTGRPDFSSPSEAETDVLWIATERGLSCRRTGRFSNFAARQGLWDAAVNAILEDDAGNLWLSSDTGIARVPKADLLAVADGRLSAATPVYYGETEGMPNPETNGQKSQPAATRTRDGWLWFATMDGVVGFDPQALPDTTNPPRVVIERIRANGEVLFDNAGTARGPLVEPARRLTGLDTTVVLPPGSAQFLEVHYTANTFVAADEVRFQHRLEGVDADWIDAGQLRAAAYANLRPARYRFHVRATNKYGVTSAEPAMFGFVLEPHFYETWTFYGLGGGLALAGALGVHRLRLAYAARIHALEQDRALAEDRARISRDLHDGLGAQLTRLTLLADLSSASRPDAASSEARLQQVASLARETARSLREIIWANHPGDGTLDGLYARICQYAEEALRPAGVSCRFDQLDGLPQRNVSPAVRHHVFLIAKEALTNTLKHADASRVEIRLSVTDSRARLSIRDNGRGMASPVVASPDHGRGLPNMCRRASAIGGRVEIYSPPGDEPFESASGQPGPAELGHPLPGHSRGTIVEVGFPLPTTA